MRASNYQTKRKCVSLVNHQYRKGKWGVREDKNPETKTPLLRRSHVRCCQLVLTARTQSQLLSERANYQTINHRVNYRSRTLVEHLMCVGTAHVREEQRQQNGEIRWSLGGDGGQDLGRSKRFLSSPRTFLPAELPSDDGDGAPANRRSGFLGEDGPASREESNTRHI